MSVGAGSSGRRVQRQLFFVIGVTTQVAAILRLMLVISVVRQ